MDIFRLTSERKSEEDLQESYNKIREPDFFILWIFPLLEILFIKKKKCTLITAITSE